MRFLYQVQNISKWIGSQKKMKDSVIVALLGGVAGTIAMDISNFLLWRKGKTEHLFGHLAGSMMMQAIRTNQRKNYILGEIFHLITGSALGLVQLEFLKKYGKDHHLIKGAGVGLVTWGLLYNFGQRMNFFSRRGHLTKTKYASIWHHLLYGLVSSQTIVILADSSLFIKNRKSVHVPVSSAQSDNIPYSWSDSSTHSEVIEQTKY